MPKVSVYLPDDLYRSARDHGLPISALTQRAIETELRLRATTAWVERVRTRKRHDVGEVDAPSVVGAVRDEFGR